MASTYTMQRGSTADFELEGDMWAGVPNLGIGHFSPRGSDHRPKVTAQIGYDSAHVFVRFEVEDRYVRCVASEYQQSVCRDSCVEFFVQPKAGKGYFNFEMNCGGTLLCYYIEDHTRTPDGFAKFTPLPVELLKQVTVLHSLPRRIDPEITEPTRWSLACRIPLTVFERYVGAIGPLPGQIWRGNLYKCGDATSHPHWASWSPLGEALNFHLPEYFGELQFA